MKIVLVRSHRPGAYTRRKILVGSNWVNVYGFLFWPNRYRSRKWAGLALVKPVSEPKQDHAQHGRQDANQINPCEVNYNPMGGNQTPEG